MKEDIIELAKSDIEAAAGKGYVDIDMLTDNMIKFQDIYSDKAGVARRVTAKSFISAVEFVTYVSMGQSYLSAYKMTFPDRAREKALKSRSNLNSSSTLYAKGDLVQAMLTRSQMANHLLFIDKHFLAMNELYRIGMEGDSEKNRVEALSKFVTETKRPEAVKIDIGLSDSATQTLDSIDENLNKLAKLAVDKMKDGSVTPQQVIEMRND